MNLLMITRRVDKDDAQAGFAYSWVDKLARKVDHLKVICLERGNIEGLPNNVEVFSMGKEKGKNRLREFINFQRGMCKFIAQVDYLFCHQNPIYTILAAPYAKLFNKSIVTWYSHKAINWQVRLINILADKILTPTFEGFGLKSSKKIVLSHGIDTSKFCPDFSQRDKSCFRVVSVGRFSPIKDHITLIQAIEMVRDRNILNKPIRVDLVGGPGLAGQKTYYDQIKDLVARKKLNNIINFIGLVPNEKLFQYFQRSHLSVNLCPTGSPDKVVLESMACGVPALACNQTFKNDFGFYEQALMFEEKNAANLAQKIINLLQISNKDLEKMGLCLRDAVVQRHNLDRLIQEIINVFKTIS